jgi:hypothetical protein
VVVLAVERLNWLRATIVCSNGRSVRIGKSDNRTDFVFMLQTAQSDSGAKEPKINAEYLK